MSKKYLIDENESHTRNGFRICEECDAKEVEVLDEKSIDQIGFTYDNESSLLLSEILKANNLQIIKIKE